MKKIILTIATIALGTIAVAQSNTELKRYQAPEARQAVAADQDHFYVVDNAQIVKRQKTDGAEVSRWNEEGLHHMNSAVIKDGKLYCAHSNYPEIPMHSSIEIFDPKTMQHIDSHSFGIENGSCTWIDFHEGHYYVMFAHYANEGKMQTNRDVSWTQLVKYDTEWRRLEGWVLPQALVERVTPYSISGGIFMENGKILATHHHHEELYILSFPKMGSELVWEKTIPSPIRGQGIAFDESDPTILWGINKKTREVIKTKINW
ncbi:hypothetical protein [Persicobacter diffluens]|uniref:Uncharacterized protein n=1 Tax=Persicobacter diffluens TaxID=981 RepID=A0AAN4W4N4_9BACT|nr:hypothetical protein PEDI_45620 [Persicobacter diffluens]